MGYPTITFAEWANKTLESIENGQGRLYQELVIFKPRIVELVNDFFTMREVGIECVPEENRALPCWKESQRVMSFLWNAKILQDAKKKHVCPFVGTGQ